MNILRSFFSIFRRKQNNPLTGVGSFSYESSIGKARPGDYTEMIKAYKSWVFACVYIISSSCARVRLRLYEKRKKEEIEEHIFLDLMRNVNPFQNRYDLRVLTQIFLELTGNAYWYLAKNRLGVPAEIWPLYSQYVKIVPDKRDFIKGYIYELGNSKVAFGRDEVIHFKYPNPRDLYYGASPLQAAADAVDISDYMKQYERSIFKNQARPDGVLEAEGRLTDEQYERLRASWNALHQGASRAGKVAILEQGLKYKPITMSPRDLDFLMGSKMTREEICAIYGVPLSKLGIVENVNRANAEANDYTFYKEVVLPRLIFIEEKLNERLIPLYDDNLLCKFDDPIPQNIELRLRMLETRLRMGYSSINEERREDGKPPVSWGDTPYLPLNLMPVKGKVKKKEVKKVNDEDRMERKWQEFVVKITGQERSFARAIKQEFSRQEKIVQANIRRLPKTVKIDENIVDYILFASEEEKQKFFKIGRSYIADAVKMGGLSGLADVGVGIDFSMSPILHWIERKTEDYALNVTETTIAQLRSTLIEGIRSGEGIEELADRVGAVYDIARRSRAVMIARTEVVGSTNAGILEGYKQSGVVKRKEWLTALDERTREWHAEANGQTVLLNDMFSVGGELMAYPGDTSMASPGNFINCRCTFTVAKEMD